MTKEHDTNEPKEVVEKTDWQKLHEEFVARQAAKKAEEKDSFLEESSESSTDELQSEEKDEEIQDTSSEDDSIVEEDDDSEESSEEVDGVLKSPEPTPTPQTSLKEEKELKKQLKAKAKAEKKEKLLEKRLKSRPLRVARLKVASIVTVALLIALVSGLIISPYSKAKQFNVTGVEHTDQASVLIATGIKKSDYISSVFLKKETIEKAIETANPWVKKAEISYRFPNIFDIGITENRIIAYAQTESGYHPVLENGVRMPVVSESDLPENFLTVNLTDEKAVQSLVTQLAKLDEKLVSSIQVVNSVANASTKDLLLLETKEGHKIRVPLSQIDVKLPFYSKIADTLTAPSIIDMEVGIYTTNETIEAIMAPRKG